MIETKRMREFGTTLVFTDEARDTLGDTFLERVILDQHALMMAQKGYRQRGVPNFTWSPDRSEHRRWLLEVRTKSAVSWHRDTRVSDL